MAALILFYSDHCQYCGMLLNSVKRYDPEQSRVRLVNIDHIRVPPTVHTVPALMLLPSKQLLFGRAAMDYLLLPSRGALVTDGPGGAPAAATSGDASVVQKLGLGGPSASGSGVPAAFAFADDATSMYETLDNSTQSIGPWETIGNLSGRPPAPQNAPVNPHPSTGTPRLPPSMGVGEETRSSKALPDLDALRAQRDREL